MQSEWAIGLMEKGDIPQAAAIEAQCFSAPWSAAMLEAETTAPDSCMLAARRVDGRLLGYGGFRWVLDEGYIGNIAVAPEARRQGIGRALVQQLIQAGKAVGLAFLTLEVRAGNEAAIALYAQAGFVPVGRRPGYYTAPREDAVLMTFYYQQ